MLFLCDDERLGEFFIATFIAYIVVWKKRRTRAAQNTLIC